MHSDTFVVLAVDLLLCNGVGRVCHGCCVSPSASRAEPTHKLSDSRAPHLNYEYQAM